MFSTKKYFMIPIFLLLIAISSLFNASGAYAAGEPGVAPVGWGSWIAGGLNNLVGGAVGGVRHHGVSLATGAGEIAVAPVIGGIHALANDGVRQDATNVGRSVAMFTIMAIIVPVALYNLASYGIPGLLNIIGLRKSNDMGTISNNQQYSYNINLPGANGEGRTKVFNQYLASHFPRVLEKMLNLDVLSQEKKDLLTVYLMSLQRTMDQAKDKEKKQKLTSLMMINGSVDTSKSFAEALCGDLGLEMLIFDLNASWLASYFSSFSGYHHSEKDFMKEMDKIEDYLNQSERYHAVYVNVSWMKKWWITKLVRRLGAVVFNQPKWIATGVLGALDKQLNRRSMYFLEMLQRHTDKVLLIASLSKVEDQSFVPHESRFRKLVF